MNKFVYLLCGLPGSGKTTWARAQDGIHISRDEIRFAMLRKGEEYFKQEKEVFKRFVQNCNEAINDNKIENVYIDATHLNPVSRLKILNRLNLNQDDKVIAVYFDIPINVCIDRNNQREGLARVPETVIYNMSNSLEKPTIAEYPYYKIKTIKLKPNFTNHTGQWPYPN